MMLDGGLKCRTPHERLGVGGLTDGLCSDPVVVMVLSLGFIASVFLLQFGVLC
jgi:hypothetical protein